MGQACLLGQDSGGTSFQPVPARLPLDSSFCWSAGQSYACLPTMLVNLYHVCLQAVVSWLQEKACPM